VTPGQLALFADPNGTGRKTVSVAGLRRDAPPGPERLLRELVKRGLCPDHLERAAALVLVLDEEPTGTP
jgi:hypothetical protein